MLESAKDAKTMLSMESAKYLLEGMTWNDDNGFENAAKFSWEDSSDDEDNHDALDSSGDPQGASDGKAPSSAKRSESVPHSHHAMEVPPVEEPAVTRSEHDDNTDEVSPFVSAFKRVDSEKNEEIMTLGDGNVTFELSKSMLERWNEYAKEQDETFNHDSSLNGNKER